LPGRPLLTDTVPAGLPATGAGCFEKRLSLDEHLFDDATFLVRVSGDSMTGFGIHDGDLLVVDHAGTPVDRGIVLARVDGEFTVKELCCMPGGVLLRARGHGHGDILVTQQQELAIWGIVRWAIHRIGKT
jgi:DNA polymerase V